MKKSTIITLSVIAAVLILTLVIALAAWLTYYLTVTLPDQKKRDAQMKEYLAFYAEQLVKYEAENKQYDDYEVDIAFVGDSITAGYDVARFYPEYTVTNRGIGGETTYGLIDRLAISVLDLKPKVCVMLIGGNNKDTMFEDYEDILIAFKEQMPETKVVLLSHSPTGRDYADWNKTMTYNNVKVKLLAEKYGCEYVDIYTPLFDIETGEMKAEYTPDGIHHTEAGYKVITAVVKPVVDELLKEN